MQLSDLNFNKTYSYADYLQWTFEERLELIKGKVFKMTPAPASWHQKVSGVIFGELYIFLRKKDCQAFSAPFDVRLHKKATERNNEIFTVVQPDICVICDQGKIDKRGCNGAPDIIVEILSLGNSRKELSNKYEVYEESGVKEYWIVSIQNLSLLRYTLNAEGQYQASRLLTLGDQMTTPILPGFVLDLDTVFEGIDPEM